MMLLLFACAEDPDELEPAFVVEPVPLGVPLAADEGFDPDDGDGLGLAFAFTLPIFGGNPSWDVPTDALALLEPPTVRDPSACPREEVEGDTVRWIGGCRSSQGYEFTGELSQREWTEDGVERYRWEGDMEVLGDREDPLFDHLRVHGFFEQAMPLEGTVSQHLDLNVHVEVDGYWEIHAPSDPAGDAWSDWTVTGSIEQRDTFWVTQVAADVGGSGGFRFDSAALDADPSCPVEVQGEGALDDGLFAVLEGVSSCDACAQVGQTLACAP